jgi:hypothetical protein
VVSVTGGIGITGPATPNLGGVRPVLQERVQRYYPTWSRYLTDRIVAGQLSLPSVHRVFTPLQGVQCVSFSPYAGNSWLNEFVCRDGPPSVLLRVSLFVCALPALPGLFQLVEVFFVEFLIAPSVQSWVWCVEGKEMSGCSPRTEETIGGGDDGGEASLRRGEREGEGRGMSLSSSVMALLKKSLIAPRAFLRFSSGSHELSSWGNPFHFTRNCFFPYLFRTPWISSTLCSSFPSIISGGGRGLDSFCLGNCGS